MKRAIIFLVASVLAASADELPDSRGKDFWFCFMPNFHSNGYENWSQNPQDSLFVYIAAEKPTTITLNYTPHDGRPPQEIRARIDNSAQMLTIKMGYYGVELKGITAGGWYYSQAERHTQRPVPYSLHLTSDEDVTVYALNHADKTSDAFLVLPTDALGKDYYVMSYNTDVYGQYRDGASTPSQFAIVATEDSTIVELVTLKAPTTDGGSARVMLRRGEVYLVQSSVTSDAYDLTGSRIKSNRPIAVFGGHQRVRVPLQNRENTASRDCLIEQLPPINTWGRAALLVGYPNPPDELYLGSDRYRILAARDSTVIYLDSVPLVTLDAGEFYEGDIRNTPHVVHSNRPILVAQFRHTSSPVAMPSNSLFLGDPFMMVIPPTEQFMSSYRFICPLAYEDSAVSSRRTVPVEVYKLHYVTIVAPDTALGSVRLDGVLLPVTSFSPIPKSRYYYTWQRLGAGVHSVSADAPIGIYVFGYGYADSYGYVGGMSYRRYDFDPPVISSLPPCPPYRLVVYDTLPGDSRVDVVAIVPDSTRNISWQILRQSLLPQDSVVVEIQLNDPYEDGFVTVRAQDAEQFVTQKRVDVPGMTLRVVGQNGSIGRPPQAFVYRSATARSSCFPVPIVNTGAFPQTVRRAECSVGTISGSPLPAVLGKGDTIVLRVCYRSTTTATITDTLWLVTPCQRVAVAVFTVEFIVDSLPPSVQQLDRDCPPLRTLTLSETGYSQSGIASVTVVDSFNVDIRMLAPPEQANSAEIQQLTIAHRDWRLDGWYRLDAADSSGNHRTIEGSFEGHTVMIADRDSLDPRQQFEGKNNRFVCDTIELYNFGLYPKRFERLVARGIEFSVPPSWVPLIIAPGERVRVPICAQLPPYDSRRDNVYRDTVELVVGCYVRRMPVTITVLPEQYDASSSCGVTIRAGSTDQLPLQHDGTMFRVETPSPATAELYDVSGRCLLRLPATGSAVVVDMASIPTGAYWLILRTTTAVYSYPVLWLGQ